VCSSDLVGTAIPGRPTGGMPSGGVPPGIPGTPDNTTPGARNKRPQYEFVVFFIWREPTPSDALIKGEGGATGP